LPKTETGGEVIIDHAYSLHEGIANGWAHELEAPSQQILAHHFSLMGFGRDFVPCLTAALNRPVADEAPEVI
jgi:hypothetical protein